jgi:hypothetical protein
MAFSTPPIGLWPGEQPDLVGRRRELDVRVPPSELRDETDSPAWNAGAKLAEKAGS